MAQKKTEKKQKTPVKKRQQKNQTNEQLEKRWELLIVLTNKQS